jgi:predicted nucleic acid-binding protein
VTTTSPLVYIDTHVFAYHLLPNGDAQLVRQAESFFNDIESGTYRGITSTFTSIDYRIVLKKVRARRKGQSNLGSRQQSALSQLEDAVMKDFDKFLLSMGIGLIDADTASVGISGKPDIFRSLDGIITPSNPYQHNKAPDWRMISASDAILVFLALRGKATRIATFDLGFKGLNNSSIIPLFVQEVYP